jgi:predicted nucleic acid-binding protein
MRTGKRIYYWDACVFVSYLAGERRQAQARHAMDQLVGRMEEGRIIIATSVITLIEVLQSKMTDQQRDRFTELFKNPFLQAQAVTLPISRSSHNIRDHLFAKAKLRVEVPDCIHLATAKYVRAEELHTFDGASPKAKNTELIKLNGKIPEFQIEICEPALDQPSLLAGMEEVATPSPQ